MQGILSENRTEPARLLAGQPGYNNDDGDDEVTLAFASDITAEIDDFVIQQVESSCLDCLLNDDVSFPPELLDLEGVPRELHRRGGTR